MLVANGSGGGQKYAYKGPVEGLLSSSLNNYSVGVPSGYEWGLTGTSIFWLNDYFYAITINKTDSYNCKIRIDRIPVNGTVWTNVTNTQISGVSGTSYSNMITECSYNVLDDCVYCFFQGVVTGSGNCTGRIKISSDGTVDLQNIPKIMKTIRVIGIDDDGYAYGSYSENNSCSICKISTSMTVTAIKTYQGQGARLYGKLNSFGVNIGNGGSTSSDGNPSGTENCIKYSTLKGASFDSYAASDQPMFKYMDKVYYKSKYYSGSPRYYSILDIDKFINNKVMSSAATIAGNKMDDVMTITDNALYMKEYTQYSTDKIKVYKSTNGLDFTLLYTFSDSYTNQALHLACPNGYCYY